MNRSKYLLITYYESINFIINLLHFCVSNGILEIAKYELRILILLLSALWLASRLFTLIGSFLEVKDQLILNACSK